MSYPLFLASSVQDRVYNACFNYGENTQAFQSSSKEAAVQAKFLLRVDFRLWPRETVAWAGETTGQCICSLRTSAEKAVLPGWQHPSSSQNTDEVHLGIVLSYRVWRTPEYKPLELALLKFASHHATVSTPLDHVSCSDVGSHFDLFCVNALA